MNMLKARKSGRNPPSTYMEIAGRTENIMLKKIVSQNQASASGPVESAISRTHRCIQMYKNVVTNMLTFITFHIYKCVFEDVGENGIVAVNIEAALHDKACQ